MFSIGADGSTDSTIISRATWISVDAGGEEAGGLVGSGDGDAVSSGVMLDAVAGVAVNDSGAAGTDDCGAVGAVISDVPQAAERTTSTPTAANAGMRHFIITTLNRKRCANSTTRPAMWLARRLEQPCLWDTC